MGNVADSNPVRPGSTPGFGAETRAAKRGIPEKDEGGSTPPPVKSMPSWLNGEGTRLRTVFLRVRLLASVPNEKEGVMKGIALALLLVPSALFAQERTGWQAVDIDVRTTKVIQAGATVLASWAQNPGNTFLREYSWRSSDTPTITWSEQGITPLMTVTFTVPVLGEPQDAEFCILTRRLSDLKESAEVCVAYTVPATDVLPPDSISVEVLSMGLGTGGGLIDDDAWVTLAWSTVDVSHHYAAWIEKDGFEVARWPWFTRNYDAHCVGHADQRGRGIFNDDGEELGDVYTWDRCMAVMIVRTFRGDMVGHVESFPDGARGQISFYLDG